MLTDVTLPAAFSVNPPGWFIHELAATTANAPPMPAMTMGTAVSRCSLGGSRFQP